MVTRVHGELNIKEGHSTRVTRVAGGPIDNPGLDMHVVRQSSEALAGVRITGTATLPGLTLFSDPVMEQSDILSYLLLGIPTSKASGAHGCGLEWCGGFAGTGRQ